MIAYIVLVTGGRPPVQSRVLLGTSIMVATASGGRGHLARADAPISIQQFSSRFAVPCYSCSTHAIGLRAYADGCAAQATVGLSLGAGFGLCGLLGVKFNQMSQICFFILFGIGALSFSPSTCRHATSIMQQHVRG